MLTSEAQLGIHYVYTWIWMLDEGDQTEKIPSSVTMKRRYPETLVHWSSSRCLPQKNELAEKLLKLLPHHSFGKCLNNVGGLDKALSFYPECANDASGTPKWWDNLHCAMSHYKFVLAIENT
ncbi:hypothetical protein ACJRO7_024502 [Eucalyptus globulus]|uniref:Uncharacterized protein n=1 Tax=Eucalyptus globulus TaxID=34317 RepID=A0ABD3K7R3_EUCGL